jgi:hypothetical protein
MSSENGSFEVVPDARGKIRDPIRAFALASIVRALIDGGAVTMPQDVTAEAIHVEATSGDQLEVSIGEKQRTFMLDDSSAPGLIETLEAQLDKLAINLAATYGEEEPSHPQW